MAIARARFIPDLLQIHLDDLAFIAGQRREALYSRRHTLREFGELNERLEAHVQGALVAPREVLLAHLQPQLASNDRDDAFAAAQVLLRLAEPQPTRAVLVEFSRASGDTLAGLRDALGLAPPALFIDEVRAALDKAKPATAAAAAVALANQRLLDSDCPRLAKLLEDDDPDVCELAWRAALTSDAIKPPAISARPFQSAVTHESRAVCDAAWRSAAWAGHAAALPLLRSRAASGDAMALHWLTILGGPEDVSVVQKAALQLDDVRQRCALLARFGHPSALNALVRWMAGEDVALAVASGEAFTRITGQDIRGERRQLPVAAAADDFDREMSPDVWLPDMKKATALMERHADTWGAGGRWCQGIRLDGAQSHAALLPLDLEARWDTAARAALAGRAISAPPPIH